MNTTFWATAAKNWKSSAQGALSALVALGVYFVAQPTTAITPKTAGVITLVTGAAKVLLGLVQKD